MIDRKMLQDIGFIRLPDDSWNTEAWYFEDANFFVFYGNNADVMNFVNGDDTTVTEFIITIIEAVQDEMNSTISELAERL